MNRKIEREISSSHLEIFSTTNGIVDEDNIRFAKENLLFAAMRRNTDLVEVHKEYPKDNMTNVRFDLDVIVLSRSRYNEMKEHEDNYLKLCN